MEDKKALNNEDLEKVTGGKIDSSNVVGYGQTGFDSGIGGVKEEHGSDIEIQGGTITAKSGEMP